MKYKRFLSLALALSLVVSSPMQGISAYATQASVNVAENVTTDDAAEKPTLSGNFCEPLEDNGGMTFADGTTTKELSGVGTVIDTTVQWNNQNQYHASVTDAATLFKKKAFTVMFDVKQNPPSGDTSVADTRVAMTIGNESKYLRLLTYSGKLGYGQGNDAGMTLVDAAGVEKDGWNAVAVTYEEKDGGNGHVIMYVNGVKSAEVADIGFKLSEMSGITATIARSYATNYLQEGRYDNIVVGDVAIDEASAIAETAYRKEVKDNWVPLPMVSIKGEDVDAAAANINGLTYKGFGMLNGNSTSNLLLDYKTSAPEKYEEMMEYLFGGEYPLFTHIKMEMGNDGNNSTGAEACTMRYEDEEADASRSPGFVMAADAKAINPDVKVSILRWEMPSWVAAKWSSNTNNAGYEAMYKWYKETIFDAYEKYGYVVDFINPDKNETGDPDEAFIKWFANRVENEDEFPDYMDEAAQRAYRNIRIIASDENKGLKIVPSMRADADLYEAVDIIGFHYRTNATDDYVKMADVDDKEVWYSEGCATFGYTELQENKQIEYGKDSIGGYQSPLALMDSFITAFDSSRRTHYMFQPAVGAFYEGIQYGHKELLSARDPWSGYIHYDPALYMLEHFAKFAKTGWEDSNPDANDIWRVIDNATTSSYAGTDNEHATAGINGEAGFMTLASPDKENFSVVFVNNTKNEKKLFVTAEDMAYTGDTLNFWLTETDNYMQNKGTITKADGGWTVTLPAYSIATATTLGTTPERTPDEDIHNEDRLVLDTDETGAVLDTTDDVLYADDFEYDEYDENYLKDRGYEPRYMLDTHGAWLVENGELKHELTKSVAQWNGGEPSTIVGDFRWMDYVTSVDMRIPDASASTYARLTVRSQTGMNWGDSGYTLSINGKGAWQLARIGSVVASGTVDVTADNTYKVAIGAYGDTISVSINGEVVANYQDAQAMLSGRVKLSSTWNQVYFDNLLVKTVKTGIPYALSMVDGQDDSVSYEGDWKIEQPGGGSADNWYRTLSINNEDDASFSFDMTGSGFAICGTNDGSAVLDVYVDDELLDTAAPTVASTKRGETYILTDLEGNGSHSVKVVVTSGTLQIDAIHALSARIESEEELFTSVATEDLPSFGTVLATDAFEGLPETVEVNTSTGAVVEKAVTWAIPDEFEPFKPGYITGTVDGGVTAIGTPLTVTVPIGMVVPEKTYYFIDTVSATPGSNETTEPYEAVKELVGDTLMNDASDQLKDDDNDWGLVDSDGGAKDAGTDTDMMATGIYAKNNTKGETLSYAFTLPAGSYRVISGHREWWGHTRTMKATVSFGDTEVDGGTIGLTGSSGDIYHATDFKLTEETLVTYTLTAQVNDAPVISFLSVVHAHDYKYTDNGDGTHTGVCTENDGTVTEAHNYENGACVECGAKDPSVKPEVPSTPSTPTTPSTPSKPQTPVKPAVAQVKVLKTKLTLGVKESYTIAPTTLPSGSETNFTYKTSNKKVATVDAKGKIKAKKTGKANITVTSANGKSVTIKVTVKKAPNKITVTTKAKTLKKGKTFKIKYKLPKNTASNKITFKSSNKKVATVDENGKVKALKKGKATITVQTFNKKKAKIKITVK